MTLPILLVLTSAALGCSSHKELLQVDGSESPTRGETSPPPLTDASDQMSGEDSALPNDLDSEGAAADGAATGDATGGGGSGGTGGSPVTGSDGSADGSTFDVRRDIGREVCSPPMAVAIFDATPAGTAGRSCNPANAIASDGAWAGLDALAAGATQIDGVYVTACIAADFGSVVNLDPVIVRARSIGNACGKSCETAFCNTGDAMLVYFGTTRGIYQFAKSIPIVPTFNDYPISLGLAARYVLVCRNGSGAARDDIAVDAIRSAAACP